MYALVEDSVVTEFPLSLSDIRQRHPNISFPSEPSDAELEPLGYQQVMYVEPPSVDPRIGYYRQSTPISDGTTLTVGWELVQYSAEQLAEQDKVQVDTVREARNIRLVNSDWTQLPDAPVDATAWAAYRQELRDITSQAGFPWEVVWPTEP